MIIMELYKDLILLQKLPLTIECTFAYDDFLLVGTKEGHLLMYKIEIKNKTPTEYEFKAHLIVTAKQFSKKPIIQIEAILEYRSLVSLSDQIISIYNLDRNSFTFISNIPKSKGATYFSLDIDPQKTLSGQIQSTVRLCVVVKYSLLFFYWKNNEFYELRSSIKLSDVAKVVVWSMNKLFVGLRNQYVQVDIGSGQVTKMFPVTSEPLIVPLSAEKNFALCKEEKTYIFDYDGRPVLNCAITWADQPLAIAEDLLFLIAVEPNSNVEILTNTLRDVIKEPLLQRMCFAKDLTKPLRTISKWRNRPGQVVLNSENDIVMLKIVPNEQQIRMMQNARYFDLAIEMIEYYNMSDLAIDNENIELEEYEKMKLKIRKMHAMDLFRRYKFTEAIALFQSLNTDPSFVIALFPDIFPEKFRSQFLTDSSIIIPTLEGAVLERGLMALIEYLVEIRLRVNKEIAQGKPNSDLKKLHELQSIIDTSLLKCYLQTNESLVASLLRIDNHCHLEETEAALKKKEKHNELIILYKSKGLHQNALSLLQHQAKDFGKNPKQARQKLIQYLQELGGSHMDLLYEYSEWILKEHPEDGIKIFIDDVYLDPQNSLPKEDVLNYLEMINPDLVLTYLDHCIFKWNETSTKFVDKLINKYRDGIRPLMADYRSDLQQLKKDHTIEILNISNGSIGDGGDGHDNERQDNANSLEHKSDQEYYLRPEPAGQEPGKLGELRRKLMHLLDVCDYYTTETLSAYLLHDGLFEERAIVLGKMGNHREALMIYVHILNDLESAEQYCWKQYEKKPPTPPQHPSITSATTSSTKPSSTSSTIHPNSNRDVFFYLFEQCLLKPDKEDLTKYFVQNNNDTSFTYNLPLLLSQPVLAYLCNEQNQKKLSQLDLNVKIAIAILVQHSTRINLLRAIEMLDDHLPLGALDLILPPAIHHLGSKNNHARILRKLLKSERLKVHQQRIQVEQANRVVIQGTEICRACMKKIGKSVFVRYTNNDLVHLGCRDGYELAQNPYLNQSA